MNMKYIGFTLLGVIILLGSLACTTEETAEAAAARIFGGSSEALLFLDCRAVSRNEIDFEFSVPVTVTSVSFSSALEVGSIENGKIVKVFFDRDIEAGIRLTADILAEDSSGNTISAVVPFRSRNDRMPRLVINELRTEYGNPRAEFIEFIALTAGNLGAMKVYVESNSKQPMIYEFQPVEVKAGEYVVLHLRKLDSASVDEYGTRLDESPGADSSPDARDFWIPGNAELLRKTDIVYMTDQDDNVLCAVMISEAPDSAWAKDYFERAAQFLYDHGAWMSAEGGICSPAQAVISANIKTAATRSISRDQTAANTNTAADWYITATGCATPGKPNNPKRFQ
jgi:hypothetical protein